MKETTTLYRLRKSGQMLSAESLYYYYDECRAEHGTLYPYGSMSDFIDYLTNCGQLDTITAHLTEDTKVYPYYFTAEDDTIFSAMDLYRIYEENRVPYYHDDTFGAFIGQSRYDHNCCPLYGFSLEA